MKKILQSIYNANKYITYIIIFQIFMLILVNVPYYNRFKKQYDFQKQLENSSVKNSVIFMGKFSYEFILDNKELNNHEELISSKNKIYDYYMKNKDVFKGITPKKIGFTYFEDNSNDPIELTVYDDVSIELVEKYTSDIIKLKENNDTDIIPVIVQENFKGRFAKDSIVKMNLEGENISFRIVGYYKPNAPKFSLSIVSTNSFNVSELLQKIQDINPNLIMLDKPELNKFKAFSKVEATDAIILYLSEKATKEDVKKFEEYIKQNSLGYYSLSDDLFEKQIDVNKKYVQGRLDLLLAFIVVNIFTFVSIGLVNKQEWKRRFRIYYLNGASKTDIYFISFLFYFIIVISSLLLYQTLIWILNINFIAYNIVNHIPLIANLILNNDSTLYFGEFMFLIVLLTAVISIISYWPVINLNRNDGRK